MHSIAYPLDPSCPNDSRDASRLMIGVGSTVSVLDPTIFSEHAQWSTLEPLSHSARSRSIAKPGTTESSHFNPVCSISYDAISPHLKSIVTRKSNARKAVTL